MKIGILSRAPRAYSTRRLREACIKKGHNVKLLNTLRFSMLVESGQPELFFKNRRLSRYDAIIPRIGASVTMYGTAVVRQFEQMGVFTLNSSQAISVSRDKLRSIQILSRHHVGIVPTAFVRDRHSVLPAIEQVGGAPVIIKLLEGTQGKGVVLAETDQAAESVIDAFRGLKAYFLTQEFIAEAKGADIRCFVIGDRVVAAMKRQAKDGEFRSNLHRGGTAMAVKITPQERATAVRAARTMGLNVAGVDLMRSHHGPVVLEVNSSPGLEGIESATGKNIAGLIIEFIEKNARPGRTKTRGRG